MWGEQRQNIPIYIGLFLRYEPAPRTQVARDSTKNHMVVMTVYVSDIFDDAFDLVIEVFDDPLAF